MRLCFRPFPLVPPLVTAAADPTPVPKNGAYSPGYYSSGDYCLGRPDSKNLIEKLGPCPPGY